MPVPQNNPRAKHPELSRLAKILPGGGVPPRYCITQYMDNGTLHLIPMGFKVPDRFILHFTGNDPAQDSEYEITWRRGNEVGAQLISSSACNVVRSFGQKKLRARRSGISE
jgi:hypothetical protein